jgi:short-subunit dehydrogenase involved in D-alanine esterification of teichoic acids
MNLKNKTILITGGASGLGLEAIGHFLAEGCRVLICGRTPRTLDFARQRHPNITTIECDITQEDDVTRLGSV